MRKQHAKLIIGQRMQIYFASSMKLPILWVAFTEYYTVSQQESHAAARKSHDAAADLFGLKFANNSHYKFKSSQASKVRLQSSKHTALLCSECCQLQHRAFSLRYHGFLLLLSVHNTRYLSVLHALLFLSLYGPRSLK